MKKSYLIVYGIAIIIFCGQSLYSQQETSVDSIAIAEYFLGLRYTSEERDSLKDGLKEALSHVKTIHNYPLENSTPPAHVFNPLPVGFEMQDNQGASVWELPATVKLPENIEELAFYTVAELSVLIRSRQISSLELTQLFLRRLKKYGDTLQCIVTITEDLALEQAKKADEELAQGKYRGPLHGIPYGAKDLLAVDGYKTTWGAMPYKDQQLQSTASVISKLEEAGAVLVAKLTLGALAMGDIWYGGKTKNPWDLSQGSSGSSAGSAAATAAGLVPFAIGTETWGSIVSPSTRCGTTGLRPTFGRVSKEGAMALSWSMDKIGPIARSAKDCALIFDAIRGTDGLDQTVIDAPFNYDATRGLETLRVGYLRSLFERDYQNKSRDSLTLQKFRKLGVRLEEVELPEDIPTSSLRIILMAEAAAAFDELTRSDRDSLLVNQSKNAWPNYFRTARFISAVDYINASRIRHRLIQKMQEIFQNYDAIITPSFGGNQLLMTNLTGHPCVVFPNGFNEEGNPVSISILGKLFGEAAILELATEYQKATEFDNQHPSMFATK